MTSGLEFNPVTAALEGTNGAGGGGARETTVVRSGAASYKVDTGAGNSGSELDYAVQPTLGTKLWGRAYVYVPSTELPGTDAHLMSWNHIGPRLLFKTDGTVQGQWGGSNTNFGSAVTLPLDRWVMLEVAQDPIGTNVDYVGWRMDGELVAETNAAEIGSGNTAEHLFIGWQAANVPGANTFFYVDDVAINSAADVGDNQNSWPGHGKVVLFLPVSDNAGASTLGTDGWYRGTTPSTGNTNLFDAVNNNPPVGVATGSRTNTSQIGCDTPSATRTYQTVCETWQSKGITDGDAVTTCRMLCVHGEPVATGTKTGTFGFAANCGTVLNGTSSAITYGNDVGAEGTYATAWSKSELTGGAERLYGINYGLGPELLITQATNTRNGDCCLMAMYAEYVPRPPDVNYPLWIPGRRL